MVVKVIIHAIQFGTHPPRTIVKKAKKYSETDVNNLCLGQTIVEVVNSGQSNKVIAISDIVSVSVDDTCLKDFLHDILKDSFDLFNTTNFLEIKASI